MAKHNATFLGPSNALISIGSDHAYAFSGVVNVTNSNEKILSFKTGKKYFVGKLQVSNGSGSADDLIWTMLMNGVIVAQWVSYNSTYWEGGLPMHLIIPPLTTVAIHGDNQTGGTALPQTAWVQGRLYD